jgi:ATP-binding cassette subfamily B protein RaxB
MAESTPELAFFRALKGARVPVVLQAEAAECALACLAMVAAAHGLRIDLPALRRRFAMSLKGATMAELLRMAGALHLGGRAVRVELDQLEQLAMPCILHWDLNHFVVLVSMRGGVATLHDPARGQRRMKLAELSPHFTGVALELVPTADFAPIEERAPVTLRALLGRVRGLRRSMTQIFLLAVALEVFVLGSPFLLQWVVDDVVVTADRDLLVTLCIGFGLLVLLQAGAAALRSWAVLHLSSSLNLQWLGNVFAHLMRLPVAWFERRHAGDVWSRFMAVQQIQKTLTTHFVEAVLDGLLVVATLAMMAFYSATLTGIALAAVGGYALLRWLFFDPLRQATEETLTHEARQASHFLESLRAVQAIKLFNRQADRRAGFMNRVVDAMNAGLVTRQLEILFSVLHRLLFGLERVAVVWVGALLVMDQRFSVGMLFAFVAFKEQFASRVSALIDKTVELHMLRLQGERLSDIVFAQPEPDELPLANPNGVEARIDLHGLCFRYGASDPDVLRHIDLTIEPGESVAIVGPSGCGKTTLLKVMLGIHAPHAGEVRIGGRRLADLGLPAWRAMVGTVMQDDVLLAGSVSDNICFFDAAPDLPWMMECAQAAALHEEIEAMPMGYHTLVGEMGGSLSGGQKQRVLLARALYKRPRILLLDEATSALDVDHERRVNSQIRRLNLTRIIVAHRPETIASAARVVVLHGGRVAQDLRSVPGAGRV